MKRIIVCLDGTWNRADGGGNPTNIVRIRDALASDASSGRPFQRIYYDEGVGTEDPIDRIRGGVFGFGLGRNVRQAYKYLSRHYETGDEIYLIGFSRGAFTARSVAGFIGACGLLTPDACTTETEQAAWSYYRTATKDRPIGDEVKLRERSHGGVTIKCIAVFDTVGTLGIPDSRLNWIGRSSFAFHDTRISNMVENALHAVALDEKRNTFKAAMWEAPFNLPGRGPSIKQVWFAGVHSDIGGGYPDDGDDPSLGRIPLRWMVSGLEALGVEFEGKKLKNFGVGPEDALNPVGRLHESRTLPLYRRDRRHPHDRPVTGIVASDESRRGNEKVAYKPIAEFLHRSVLDRRTNDETYRPINLESVMPMVESGLLPVVGWDGTVLPAVELERIFPWVSGFRPGAVS